MGAKLNIIIQYLYKPEKSNKVGKEADAFDGTQKRLLSTMVSLHKCSKLLIYSYNRSLSAHGLQRVELKHFPYVAGIVGVFNDKGEVHGKALAKAARKP